MFSRPFETRSLPSLLAATHRGFAFYVAFPKSSIRPVGLPIYVARTPAAPFASRAFDISRAANSRRLNLFERGMKCRVEFCFFLVRACFRDTGEIFARRSVDLKLKDS